MPAARSRRPPPRCAAGDPRELRPVRRRGEPRRVRALLLSRGVRRRTPGGDLPRPLRHGSRACCPTRGRFYLQTMVFGRNMIPVDDVDIDAPRDSDAWYLALMGRQFPGSCLRSGQEQVIRSAEPHFRLVSSSSGRLDYIETIRQWRQRFARAERQEDAAQAAARAPLAHQRRLPARIHLRREREQRLLRARAARPLPARLREGRGSETARACAKVTSRPLSSSHSFRRTARRPSHSESVGTAWKTGFSSCARWRL